jgi:GT2 family glycosyltransferase
MLDLALQRLSVSGFSRPRVMRPLDHSVTRPRVSVVIPCYNYGRFLGSCVGSVLSQEDVDVDILIVDDASPDGSGDVAEALAAADARVRVHRNEVNLGHIATYNTGFARVDGEYVLLLSADDMLTPGALARAARLLEANPSVGFAYGWSIEFSEEPPPPARTRTRSWSVWKGGDWLEDNCRRASNVIKSSDALVRRSVLERVGGYRPELPHSGDHEWWMRAAQVADVGMVCGVDQYYYRIHGTNMSREPRFVGTLANLRETRNAFDAALDGSVSDDAGRLERLRRTARAALAAKALRFAVADYMAGDEGVAAVESYRRFALETDPSVRGTRAWRALERREAAGAQRAHRNRAFRARELVWDLETRLRWRRARYSGV